MAEAGLKHFMVDETCRQKKMTMRRVTKLEIQAVDLSLSITNRLFYLLICKLLLKANKINIYYVMLYRGHHL